MIFSQKITAKSIKRPWKRLMQKILYETKKERKFLMDHCGTKSKLSLISTLTKTDKFQICYESFWNKVVNEILLQQTENIRDSVWNHFVKQIRNHNFIKNHFLYIKNSVSTKQQGAKFHLKSFHDQKWISSRVSEQLLIYLLKSKYKCFYFA
jgi:hypothetical protein